MHDSRRVMRGIPEAQLHLAVFSPTSLPFATTTSQNLPLPREVVGRMISLGPEITHAPNPSPHCEPHTKPVCSHLARNHNCALPDGLLRRGRRHSVCALGAKREIVRSQIHGLREEVRRGEKAVPRGICKCMVLGHHHTIACALEGGDLGTRAQSISAATIAVA